MKNYLTILVLVLVVFAGFSQTTKTIIAQSKKSNLTVRVKEHYGSYKEYTGVQLAVYDNLNIYLGRKLEPTIMFPLTRWSIDSIWSN